MLGDQRLVPVALTQLRQFTHSISAMFRICFLPRPPACLPIQIPACGQHGYWFSPVSTYPEGVDFELVVEVNATEVSARLFLSFCLKRCTASGHTWEDT
jgi:hypothetical protein